MDLYEQECKKIQDNPELLIEYNKLCKCINDHDNKVCDVARRKLLIYSIEGEEIQTNKYYTLTFKTMCIFKKLTITNHTDFETKKSIINTY